MKSLFLLFAGLLFTALSSAATGIHGRITDEKGMPLPFATVLEKGTTNGTSANGDGYYTLELSPGPHTLSCQYMGYQTVTQQVELAGASLLLNFSLQPQAFSMTEVVIKAKGEDPAYPIMRKVIAQKEIQARQVRTLTTEIYLKGLLRTRIDPESFVSQALTKNSENGLEETLGTDASGNGIVYLLEQLSTYAYQAPDKEYTKVLSVRQSGDPQGLGFATMPPVINIYDNNITLLEGLNARGFISPAHSNAFHYYRYKYLGSMINGGRVIKKIRVTPKRKFEPLFSGDLYVVEDAWVFQSVALTLTRESQMDLLDTLHLEQYYIPVAGNNWIIQNQVLQPVIRILGVGIAGSFLTAYKNQKINRPLPATLWNPKTIASYDSAALQHTSSFWDTVRPVPLEQEELLNYRRRDSLYVINKAKKDSLSRVPAVHLRPDDFLLSNPSVHIRKNTWSMQPLINSVAYNTVEGINATLGLSWLHRFNESQSLKTDFRNRYGFSNHRYQALLNLEYNREDPRWKERKWQVNAQGGRYVYQINPENPIGPFMNEVYTLLAGANYMKLYEGRSGSLRINRSWGNGLKAALGFTYEQRDPLSNTAFYSFRGNPDPEISSNQPSELPLFEPHKAAVIDAVLSYQPGWRYIQYPDFKMPVPGNAPVFTLGYTKGLPDIGGSLTDFDKWYAGLRHSFGMRLLGTLDYRVEAGGFLHKNYVGLPDRKHLNGNQTLLASPYLASFQLAPYYRFSNTADVYLQAHAEWHLSGLLTNKIPLFRRLNWHLVLGSNVFMEAGDYYTEVFAGLENIGFKMFRLGRVDLVTGYEKGSRQPAIGLRLSLGEEFWNLIGSRSKN